MLELEDAIGSFRSAGHVGFGPILSAGLCREILDAIVASRAFGPELFLSQAEFDAAITSLKNAGAAEARTAEADRESRQHLWQYLLAAMMMVLAVEGVVAAKTT